MSGQGYQNELLLAQAFKALVVYVAAGNPAAAAPAFTYLLSNKQFDEIRRMCIRNGWPVINCRGILIDHAAVAHPLQTRRNKDRCSELEIADILSKAYCPRSVVRENGRQGLQAIVLNAHQRITIGADCYYCLAIVELRSNGARNYLAPVTAYHATEAKKRSLF